MQQVITASRLRDGVVVFRGAGQSWVERLEQAQLFDTGERATTGLQQAQKDEATNLVLDVYAIDVIERNGVVRPVRLREAIRAEGPTIHPEHGKQARGL